LRLCSSSISNPAEVPVKEGSLFYKFG